MGSNSVGWLVIIRCTERLIVVGSASLICFLGYQLYVLGVTHGPVEFTVKDFLLKGTGPGIAFMGGGVFLLWRALATPIQVTVPGDNGCEQIVIQGATTTEGKTR